jgi:hypothetical protein
MRRRAYSRIAIAALLITLLATTLAPDVVTPFLKNPHESASARAVAENLFKAITKPPQVAARIFGVWIDSHSAQLWPHGWPAFAALALRIILTSTPFWALIGILAFEVIRLALVPWRRTQTIAPADPPADECRRCGKRIEENAANADVFEGMHWLCFHLEFEHDADPDVACHDFAGCPWWTIAHLERKVKELGLDPAQVVLEAVQRHADEIQGPRAEG